MAIIETSENAKDLPLQTHYYKATYKQVKEVYLAHLETLKHKVVSVNDDYLEVYSEVPHMFVVAKFFSPENTVETGIDFYVDAEYLVGSNKKAIKFIESVYKKIEEKY